MDAAYLDTWAAALAARRVVLAPGLSPGEIAEVESWYGFRFPPDLKLLIQHALPVSRGFPDWRRAPEADLRYRLAGPTEGILFDVEYNGFWMTRWGPRPPVLHDALDVAQHHLASVPPLVPVYGHRYISSEPPVSGNPVYSVVQTDIICYGTDLATYFAVEFGVPRPAWAADSVAIVRFWDYLETINSFVTRGHAV